jgi:hypothetical protein
MTKENQKALELIEVIIKKSEELKEILKEKNGGDFTKEAKESFELKTKEFLEDEE